jgi:hypothetical protein
VSQDIVALAGFLYDEASMCPLQRKVTHRIYKCIASHLFAHSVSNCWVSHVRCHLTVEPDGAGCFLLGPVTRLDSTVTDRTR